MHSVKAETRSGVCSPGPGEPQTPLVFIGTLHLIDKLQQLELTSPGYLGSELGADFG
uniref:Uncharacterized protein n=1 Tax=Anguilla anguilla TaxID=7936 RepID=A0A0E9VFT0_ANGAN